jgi:hypothetical protein
MNKQSQSQTQTPKEMHPDSLQAMIKFGLDVLLLIASIFAAPAEMALRRRQGTRYQNLVVLGFAQLPILFFAGLGMTAGKSLNDNGLIGIGWVCLAFTVLQWVHFYHMWKMMCDPHREVYSYEDGVELPFWKHCPGGTKWARIRFLYEPGLLIGSAVILGGLRVISTAAAIYIALAGGALFIKVTFLWYRTWEYLREILDQYGLSLKLAGGNKQNGMEAVKAAIAQAAKRIPSGVPMAALASVRQTAKAALPPELNAMLSEPASVDDRPDEQGALDLLSPA